jgi:hypothetical protein
MVCRGSLRRYGGMTLSRVCGDPRRQLAGARADRSSGFGASRRPWRVTDSRAMRADPPRQLAGARADPPEEGGLRATGAASDAFVSGFGASCRP